MEAKVKPNLAVNDVILNNGPSPLSEVCFTAQEWKAVPAGLEKAAKVHPHLMVSEGEEDRDSVEAEVVAAQEAEAAEAEAEAEEGVGNSPMPEINATDTAVEMMLENGIDASMVTGSGANGRILKKDVEAFLASG